MTEIVESSEVRWFGEGACPGDVDAWFSQLEREAPCVAEPLRHDTYLVTRDAALGIKQRERGNGVSSLEVKHRSPEPARIVTFAATASGNVADWVKWSFAGGVLPATEDRHWLRVAKDRVVRKYRATGCEPALAPVEPATRVPTGVNVELTRLEARGRRSWTVAFEAFGADAPLRRALVEEAARRVLGSRGAPPLPLSASFDYPRWIEHAAGW